MARPRRDQLFDALLDFARVVGTSIGGASSVIARVSAAGPTDYDDGEDVEEVDADAWGTAAVLHRPFDPTSEGACESIIWRTGDERVVIATKDLRWQLEIEKGEVVLRNTVPSGASTKQAHILIKANGEVVIDAEKVYVGDAGAGHTIGWGDAIKNHLSSLKSWADGHIHTAVTTATVGTGPVGTVTVAAPTSASPSVPAIESTHKVE